MIGASLRDGPERFYQFRMGRHHAGTAALAVPHRDGGRRGRKVQIPPSSFNASACRSAVRHSTRANSRATWSSVSSGEVGRWSWGSPSVQILQWQTSAGQSRLNNPPIIYISACDERAVSRCSVARSYSLRVTMSLTIPCDSCIGCLLRGLESCRSFGSTLILSVTN